MEQILVYKDPAFDKEEKKYKWVQQELQNLVNGLKRIGIMPTDENIKKLLKGESLVSEMADNMINDGFSQLPRKAKNYLANLFKEEQDEDYNKEVGNLAAKLAVFKASGTSTINFDYFHVDNGAVIISPEYIDDLKRMYCIYIDTDARLNVYTKWKNFEKAKNEFDEAVKKAPKKEPTQIEQIAGVDGQYLKAVATSGQFALSKILFDGELCLNGKNFEYIN